jgi:YD repeat-containing protein
MSTLFAAALSGGLRKSQQVGNEEPTTYEYDGVGQLCQMTRPDGRSFGFRYDGAHRLRVITDNGLDGCEPLSEPRRGNAIVYTLDLMGNPTQEEVFDRDEKDPVRTQTRNFDPLGCLESLEGIEKINDEITSFTRTSFKYDDHDNLVGITDRPLGLSTPPWTYDALDRLETSFDLNGAKTEYHYDGNDRLDVLTDPLLLETLYDVDGLDNLINVDSPDTGLTTYSPDEAGNVESRTDARGAEGFATYSYDELNRVKTIEFRGGAVTFNYDEKTNDIGEETRGIGRLTQMIDGTGTTHLDV